MGEASSTHAQHFAKKMLQTQDAMYADGLLFGVFDGHGAVGHTVSQFVKKKWPETMDRALMNGKKKKKKRKWKWEMA